MVGISGLHIIGSGNGLSPAQHQAMAGTIYDLFQLDIQEQTSEKF